MPTSQGEPQRESQENAAEGAGGERWQQGRDQEVWTTGSGQSGDGAEFLESEGEERARSQMESWGGFVYCGEGGERGRRVSEPTGQRGRTSCSSMGTVDGLQT